MALTEEQQERIRLNREKALALQRKRRQQENTPQSSALSSASKKLKAGENSHKSKKDTKKEGNIELELFEQGASEYVTKAEAKSMYCLPEGTLAVCQYTEKPNPHRSSWNPIKLYDRAEIRRRARERYGGMEGLIEERTKRQNRKFEKDMKNVEGLL